jgi:hypothetical protein
LLNSQCKTFPFYERGIYQINENSFTLKNSFDCDFITVSADYNYGILGMIDQEYVYLFSDEGSELIFQMDLSELVNNPMNAQNIYVFNSSLIMIADNDGPLIVLKNTSDVKSPYFDKHGNLTFNSNDIRINSIKSFNICGQIVEDNVKFYHLWDSSYNVEISEDYYPAILFYQINTNKGVFVLKKSNF